MRRLAFAIPLVLGFAAYVNTASNGFVLDDYHFIVDNAALKNVDLGALFGQATVTAGGAFYRPLGILSFVAEHAVFGMTPGVFHLGSVFYHLLAVAAVMWFARRLAGASVALTAGTLFAVHPVHTEAVTGLANRPELMATALAAAVLALHSSKLRPRWRIPLQNLVFLAALLCKESAITVPAALGFVALYAPGPSPVRRAVTAGLSLVPALACYLLLRQNALSHLAFDPSLGYFHGEAATVRALTVLKVFPLYARLLFMPNTLSADYSRDTIANANGLELEVALGLALVAGLGTIAVLGRRRTPHIALGVCIFSVGMLPYLQLTPLGCLVAERYLYLPSAGFCIAVAAGIVAVAHRLPRPRLAHAALAVVAAWMVIRTADRNLDWRTPLTLWESTVKVVPRSAFAHGNLGLSAYWAGQPERARAEMARAIAIAPRRIEYRVSLAQMHHEAGDHGEERATLIAASMADPDSPLWVEPLARARAETRSP